MARREARSIITVVHGVDARARRRLRQAAGAGRRGEALHAHVRRPGPGRVSRAHTCFNRIDLPLFTDRTALSEAFDVALRTDEYSMD